MRFDTRPRLENNQDVIVELDESYILMKKDKLLKDLYNDRKTGQGIGIRLFYNLVSGKYLNITRMEVQDFLRRQGDYSISRPYKQKSKDKPVLAKKPMKDGD